MENAEIKSIIEDGLNLCDAVITATHDIVINGTFKGTLLSSANVYIEKKAVIKGDIAANCIEIKGVVSGSIYANDSLKLMAGSSMNGRIFYNNIFIESGGHFEGLSCQLKSGEFEQVLKRNKNFRNVSLPQRTEQRPQD